MKTYPLVSSTWLAGKASRNGGFGTNDIWVLGRNIRLVPTSLIPNMNMVSTNMGNMRYHVG